MPEMIITVVIVFVALCFLSSIGFFIIVLVNIARNSGQTIRQFKPGPNSSFPKTDVNIFESSSSDPVPAHLNIANSGMGIGLDSTINAADAAGHFSDQGSHHNCHETFTHPAGHCDSSAGVSVGLRTDSCQRPVRIACIHNNSGFNVQL